MADSKNLKSLLQRLRLKACSQIWDNVKSLAPVILLILAIRSSVIEPYRIPSGSMIPTLLVGDFIFVNKFAYGLKLPFSEWLATKPVELITRKPPARGDIIVFKYPRDESLSYIKRVIGIPGDRIRILNKELFVNGTPVEREPLRRPELLSSLEGPDFTQAELELFFERSSPERDRHLTLYDRTNRVFENIEEFTVPDDRLFVMGDNRDFSADSRVWGFVPMQNVKGRAMVIWFSLWVDLAKGQFYFHPSRIGTVLP